MEEETKTTVRILSGKNCCHSPLLNIKFNTVKPSTWDFPQLPTFIGKARFQLQGVMSLPPTTIGKELPEIVRLWRFSSEAHRKVAVIMYDKKSRKEGTEEEGVFGARSRVLMLSRESSCNKQTNSWLVICASRSRGKLVNYMSSLRSGYIDPIHDLGKLHLALKHTCSWTLGFDLRIPMNWIKVIDI